MAGQTQGPQLLLCSAVHAAPLGRLPLCSGDLEAARWGERASPAPLPRLGLADPGALSGNGLLLAPLGWRWQPQLSFAMWSVLR